MQTASSCTVSLTPAVPGDLVRARYRLAACFQEVRRLLLTDSLRMNEGKTEYLCVMPLHHLAAYTDRRP